MDKAESLSLSLEQGAMDILLELSRFGGQSPSSLITRTGLTTEEVSEFLTVLKRNRLTKIMAGVHLLTPDGINYLRDRKLV